MFFYLSRLLRRWCRSWSLECLCTRWRFYVIVQFC